ncbi:MAG: MerR family transcriptional regulator [Actinobacteria bacterium]|nr:MerR family transcriptional regulator [Actinomycetota bacterium]MCA1721012.1 MerR family transcriptional regulator [Actinomycetota bacterium]
MGGAEHRTAPGLPVASVARRLGVAPATLRTWARRYGLGPSEHAAGAHRRYAAADLARLEVMRRLTLEGVPPSDAARAALAADVGAPRGSGSLPDRHGRIRSRPGGPGGRVLALPGADDVARGLGRAAMALDSRAVTEMLRAQLAAHGVVATWEGVLRPVLGSVGDRWAATGEGVEVEHLLADCAFLALREVAERAHEPLGGRPVLLAGAPGEQHSLPLHVLSAGLAERGLGTRTLGPALPADALQAAVRRTGPALLFLWSQLSGTADVSVLTGLPAMKPPTALVVGGPGWSRRELPAHVNVTTGLADALDLVQQAVGA